MAKKRVSKKLDIRIPATNEELAGGFDSLLPPDIELPGEIDEPITLFEEELKEMVKEPSHYAICDTTVNDIIKAAFTHSEYMGWLKGNIIKYRMRAGKKNTYIEDLAKADRYQLLYEEYLEENTP